MILHVVASSSRIIISVPVRCVGLSLVPAAPRRWCMPTHGATNTIAVPENPTRKFLTVGTYQLAKMLLQLAPFTLLPLFAQLTCATGPNWTISNGTGITPYIGNVSSNPTTQVNDTVYNRILLNHGYVDRLNYIASLNDSSLWKFNFNPATAGATASRGAGGLAVLADKATFPALINTGVSMAMGFLEPCGT